MIYKLFVHKKVNFHQTVKERTPEGGGIRRSWLCHTSHVGSGFPKRAGPEPGSIRFALTHKPSNHTYTYEYISIA